MAPSFLVVSLALLSAQVCCQIIEDLTINCHPTAWPPIPLKTFYDLQPVFLTVYPYGPGVDMVDNICVTTFPQVDDPYTYTAYQSVVYKDGSNKILSILVTEVKTGHFHVSTPFYQVQEYMLGYVGCETYIVHACLMFGGKEAPPPFYGASASCRPLPLSCMRNVREVADQYGYTDLEFYLFPMQLPNRCVTQQLCTLPPNPFSGYLGKPLIDL